MQMQGESRASAETPGSTGEIGALLLRAADCLHAAVAPHLAEAGLNGSRFGVLEAIRAHGDAGCSQARLAARLLQSESNLSTLLERMRLDGLIVRERSAADRRKSVIRLTPGGEQVLNEAAKRRATVLARLLDKLDDPHKKSLTAAIPALIGALEHRGRERRVDAAAVSPPSISAVGRRQFQKTAEGEVLRGGEGEEFAALVAASQGHPHSQIVENQPHHTERTLR